MIRAYRLYTGADGMSHVECGTVPSHVPVHVERLEFRETAAHGESEWHTAPREQYVITLSGTLEFRTRGGETFTVRPGDVLIALDVTGSGHDWRLIDDQPWRRAYVVLAAGVRPAFVYENTGG